MEKTVYAPVHLKNGRDYIILFDIEIEPYYNEPTILHVDLWAPLQKHDLQVQERIFHLDTITKYKKIYATINAMDIPEPTLFRIFYFTPNCARLGNIQIRELTFIGENAHLSIFLLITVISIYYLKKIKIQRFLSGFRSRAAIRDKFNIFFPADDTIRFSLSLLSIYLFFVILRFLFSLLIQNPLIPTDELAYKNMAYSYFKTGSFYNTKQLGLAVNVPNILYQWLVSRAFLFGDNFFVVIKLINAVVMNTVIFPIFFLLKNHVSNRKSVFTGILVLTLSSMNFVCFVMVEALFLPLFILTFFLLYKSLVSEKLCYPLLSGLSLGLLVLTKINGISLAASFLVTTLVVVCVPNGRDRKPTDILETLFFTILAFLFSYLILNRAFKGEFSFSLGYYDQVVKDEINREIFSLDFWVMVLAHFTIFLSIFFIPMVVMIKALARALRKGLHAETYLIILTLITAGFFFTMVFKFSADIAHLENFRRLHARYYFVIFPLFIASFFIFANKIQWKNRQKITALFLYSVVVVSTVFFFLPRYANLPLVIVDYPEFSWFFSARSFKSILVGISIFSLVCTGLYFFLKTNNQAAYLGFFIILTILSNYGQIAVSKQCDIINSTRINMYLPIIGSFIQDRHASVAIIEPGNDYRLSIAFWYPYHYERSYLLANDATLTPDVIPEKTQYLILFGHYKIDLPDKRTLLYRDENLSIVSLI